MWKNNWFLLSQQVINYMWVSLIDMSNVGLENDPLCGAANEAFEGLSK